MDIIQSVKNFFVGPGQLPPVQLPKAPGKQQTLPSFKKQVTKATSALSQTDRRLTNKDLTTYRTGADTKTVIRDLAAASPDMAATINAYLRVGIPDRYTVLARDPDGVINVEATKMAQEMLRRLTFIGDPSLGYNPVTDLQSISESMAKELLFDGAMAMELVLDKTRTPTWFQPVSVTKLKWYEEDQGAYPVQVLGGNEVKLDIPTFFYVAVDQDLLTAYASSYVEAAIQPILADMQFLNDLRKSMTRVIQPRLIASIVEDKVKKTIPPDILNDPDKLSNFYSSLITQLEDVLNGLSSEDALVSFDSVDFNLLSTQGGSQNIGDTLATVQKLLESKVAAGTKSLPSVLGRDSNGTTATVGSMLFLKNANIIRTKLNLLYSRALTTAVRLMAMDVHVEFKYAEIDLRPQAELEAYKSMEQSRILEQLSLGFITDEEASIMLTGNLPRDGHTPLAGTMFKGGGQAASANPDSQTSNMGAAGGKSAGGAPDKQKPNTPTQPKN